MSNPRDLVARKGFFTGLHSGMGIASKAMVVVLRRAHGNSSCSASPQQH